MYLDNCNKFFLTANKNDFCLAHFAPATNESVVRVLSDHFYTAKETAACASLGSTVG